MCGTCFQAEVQSFQTQEEYDTFDLELTKKIANSKTLIMKGYVTTGWKDKGYQIYECTQCGQIWHLKTKDEGYKGFSFVKAKKKRLSWL